MFRVLIADDENSVIQSMVGSVPWVELGLVVAAMASDGREALRLAQEEWIPSSSWGRPGCSGKSWSYPMCGRASASA